MIILIALEDSISENTETMIALAISLTESSAQMGGDYGDSYVH